MRVVIFSAMSLFLAASVSGAATPSSVTIDPPKSKAGNAVIAGLVKTKLAARKDEDDENRRCAFLGRFGSFTVIGSTGTAAYMLGKDKYIAGLRSAGEDPNWWMYRPTGNGDPSTTMWAFARNPRCGKYNVLRFANGAWRQYEQTSAWGIGLGGFSGAAAAASSAGPTNQELLDKLRDIEGKLNAIQPGPRPSLIDIENAVKNKP